MTKVMPDNLRWGYGRYRMPRRRGSGEELRDRKMKIVKLDDIPQGEVSHNPKVKKKQVFHELASGKIVNFSQAYFPPGFRAFTWGIYSHRAR